MANIVDVDWNGRKLRRRYGVMVDGSLAKRTVRAHTKGEARAFFKRMVGIAPKNRLPAQYTVVEVDT